MALNGLFICIIGGMLLGCLFIKSYIDSSSNEWIFGENGNYNYFQS